MILPKSIMAKPLEKAGREAQGLRCGSLAQLGEHLPYKQGVTGSSPVIPTIMAR